MSPQGAFFLRMSSGMEPAVGYGVTRDPLTTNALDRSCVIAVLEAEAIVGDCDLIGEGVIVGARRGIWFDPTVGK